MSVLSPRNRLIAWLALAGVGLVLFFSGEYRDLGLPLGWFGSVLFIASVWFAVDAVHRLPRSDDEGTLAPGEWQAWVGLAFVGAVVGEYLGSSQGVGYLILQAEGSFDINTVMAGILVLTAFALALDAAVGRIERRLMRWQPQAGDGGKL